MSTMLIVLCAALLFSPVLYILVKHYKKRANGLPLPPGPPADPLIGHLRLIPPTNAEETFREWGKTYGSCFWSKSRYEAHDDQGT